MASDLRGDPLDAALAAFRSHQLDDERCVCGQAIDSYGAWERHRIEVVVNAARLPIIAAYQRDTARAPAECEEKGHAWLYSSDPAWRDGDCERGCGANVADIGGITAVRDA